MFKLIQNILAKDANHQSDIASSSSNVTAWEQQIVQADALWEKGKLSEALAIYGLAIEQNPGLLEIQQRLAERLKQQGDLAMAYERLASGLKNKGNIEQAANYYRQAINLKALTGNTKDQLLRSNVNPVKRMPIPLANLKEAAFSFQPLAKTSAIVQVADSRQPFDRLDFSSSSSTTPNFPPRIKAVNPSQARDIDWETAQVYFQKALEHLELQEWEQTALACRQATRIMPDMAEAYKIWGNALQRMGKTGEAMSCYAKAVEVKPNLAEVYAGIADIYVQQEKWLQAVKHYQKAIIIRPSADTHRKLARAWKHLGESGKVEFNLYRATELELDDTQVQTSGGEELDISQLNNIEESIAAYCRKAQNLEQRNQWQRAAKYYRQALDLSMSRLALPPQETPIAAPSLTTNEPLSQLDKAIQRYHQQAKLQPNSPKILTDLGNLYAKQRKFQRAIGCYQQAIKLNSKYPKAYLSLARVMLKLGRQVEFIKAMQLALSMQPEIGTEMDRYYLGNALLAQSQFKQAISLYYKATVLNPKFAPSYHRLSEILSKQGKHEEAVRFLKQAIEHNPQDPDSYYLLALQWEKLQNWENAVTSYSRVLQIEPQFPQASQKLNHALAEKLKEKVKRQATPKTNQD